MNQHLEGRCPSCSRTVTLDLEDKDRVAYAYTGCDCGHGVVTVYGRFREETPVTDSVKPLPGTYGNLIDVEGGKPGMVASSPPHSVDARLMIGTCKCGLIHGKTLRDDAGTILKSRCEMCGEAIAWNRARPTTARVDAQAAKTPHDPATLAESVALVVKLAQDRVGPDSIGAQQYWKPGEAQKFEHMALPSLIEYAEEEALDAINYAVMQVLRFRRLKEALATRELFIECPTCYGNRKAMDCGSCHNEGYVPLMAPGK